MEEPVVKRKWGAFFPVLLSALISILWSSSALAEQKEWGPSAARRKAASSASQVLSGFSSLEEVSQYLGSLPEDCEVVSDVGRVCVWRRGEGQQGWSALAHLLETEDGINVICEFRKEDGSVEESSCSAHPQRSNRDYFKGVEKKANRAIRKAKVGTTIDRSRKIAAARASSRRFIMEHRKLTEKVIAGSQTGFQMSTVVGDIPVSCFEIRDEYLCEWKTHAGTEGHGTLAWWIETDFFDKVRMTCRFPSDESPRAEGSCSAQVGD